ncbi:hypothetical protein pb186bvf_000973 [Paramecium bursaria]
MNQGSFQSDYDYEYDHESDNYQFEEQDTPEYDQYDQQYYQDLQYEQEEKYSDYHYDYHDDDEDNDYDIQNYQDDDSFQLSILEKNRNQEEKNQFQIKPKRVPKHNSFINRRSIQDSLAQQDVILLKKYLTQFQLEGDLALAIDNTEYSKFRDILDSFISVFFSLANEKKSENVYFIKEIFLSKCISTKFENYIKNLNKNQQQHFYSRFFQSAIYYFQVTDQFDNIPLNQVYSQFKIQVQLNSLITVETKQKAEKAIFIYQDFQEKKARKQYEQQIQLKKNIEFHRMRGVEIDYDCHPAEPDEREFKFFHNTSYAIFGQIFPIPQNHAYLSPQSYLNNHFYILREDYIANFRQGVFEAKQTQFNQQPTVQNIYLYKNVSFVDIQSTLQGLIFKCNITPLFVDWTAYRRLMAGALIMVTDQQMRNFIFGSIISNNGLKQLQFKLINQQFEYLQILIKLMQQGSELYMIENTTFYEPYIYYLKAIQQQNPENIPFKNQIIYGKQEDIRPLYLEEKYGIQVQISTNNGKTNPFNLYQDWPQECQGSLDSNQYLALQSILRCGLSLIQGPPGTGKTYCGALALKQLMNQPYWLQESKSPIIIICYTNHALDQFLKHILEFVKKDQVVRIGGRSKDPVIQQLTLQNYTKVQKINYEWKRFLTLKEQVQTNMNYTFQYKQKLTAFSILKLFPEQANKIINKFAKIHESFTGVNFCKTAKLYILKLWMNIKNQKEIIEMHLKILEEIQEQESKNKQTQKQVLQEEERYDRFVYMHEYNDSDCEYEEQFDWYQFEDNLFEQQYDYNYEFIDDLEFKYSHLRTPLSEQKISKLWSTDRLTTIQKLEKMLQMESLNWDKSICQEYLECIQDINQLYTIRDINVIKNKKIVGVTVTGCAKYASILKNINAKIMVIEEAAEVLESHCAAIITENIQHLILIGDHLQLRPKLESFNLEVKYKTNISLFERLINNGFDFITLNKQRRMRSDFADFVRLIYGQDYQDHECIQEKNKIKIRGMANHMIFFDHQVMETSQQNQSKYNEFECNMVVQLASYLVKNLYGQEQITILSMYLRQVNMIKFELSKLDLRQINVQTVDNYQGEENDIIILSLVRSNQNHSLGFIGIDNRICVAFSRARLGFYIFGNFSFIQKSINRNLLNIKNDSYSDLWLRIIDLAKKKNLIQSHLLIVCSQHGTESEINLLDDWNQSPKGGCKQICKLFYDCGHQCSLICHPQPHSRDYCYQQCKDILPCTHKCKGPCKVKPCPPCKQKIYLEMKCGHFQSCFCSEKNVRCLNKCEKALQCGHECQNRCYEKCEVDCYSKIDYKLECGHQQSLKCHEINNNQQITCNFSCQTELKCGHKCIGQCGQCFDSVHYFCTQSIKMKCKHFVSCAQSKRECQVCYQKKNSKENGKLFDKMRNKYDIKNNKQLELFYLSIKDKAQKQGVNKEQLKYIRLQIKYYVQLDNIVNHFKSPTYNWLQLILRDSESYLII